MIFFKNLKKHMKLFEKHRNFFLDFIKITTLFSQNKISTEFFTITIGSLFGLLRKKNHNKFFSFLEFLLGIILNQNSNLIGIKTLFSGRISGKTMASSKIVSQGKVAIQCLNKNIIFQKVHIYTIYGVFGLKLWVHNK